ncbi:MAG: ATP-binding protein [Candidatus Electrothrix scaldis]|nr:MAG: ATP-binding protein [Candidatus Electrothrix sp. GW3-3]
MLQRSTLQHLVTWQNKKTRKPLVIRGARQVGKSCLVRLFAEQASLDLMEINLELNEDYIDCFTSKDPRQITALLELKTSRKIQPGKTLLFLDEIQAAPRILASLRYFYELMPELHVIAAGSLLEFVLEEHTFSMPVGRIEYLHLGPMTFKEFLIGIGKEQLSAFLEQFEITDKLPKVIHDELIQNFKIYCAVGGMPEAVQVYQETGSMLEANAVKQSVLLTYRDDFSKYGQRINRRLLQNVFQSLPLHVGQKLKYVNLDRNEKSTEVKKTLHLLALARVYAPVYHTAANGIPLRAECNQKVQKPLFLDVGLLTTACGMSYADIAHADDVALINAGSLCEQFIGQHLLYARPPYEEPELFYWVREKRQASSEIDYALSVGGKIFPVEVKAGKTGTLKSLQVFLQEKGRPLGVRFNADLPSLHETTFSLPNTSGTFRLLSLPLYLVEELLRLIRATIQE